MTGCSIVISVIVLDLHHHEPFTPVPNWLKRLAFNCMARLLCTYSPYRDMPSPVPLGSTRFNRSSTRNYGNHSSLMSAGMPITDDEESVHLQQQSSDHENAVDGMNNVVKGFYDELESLMAPRRKKPILEEMLQHLREITNKMRKNIKKDQIKSEWKMVAKVLDRFLLVCFLVSVSAFTLYILYIYPRVMMPPVQDIGAVWLGAADSWWNFLAHVKSWYVGSVYAVGTSHMESSSMNFHPMEASAIFLWCIWCWIHFVEWCQQLTSIHYHGFCLMHCVIIFCLSHFDFFVLLIMLRAEILQRKRDDLVCILLAYHYWCQSLALVFNHEIDLRWL